MERFTNLKIFWNKNKEKIDFLIYVPHGSIDKNFIKKVKETSKVDIKNISDELLYKYLYHEADTWVNEVINFMEKYFLDSEFSIWVLNVKIPRWFCDLNRPLEIAIPEVFRDKSWEDIYKKAEKEIEEVVEKSDFVFHFHSMNWFNPIEKSVFDENISEDFIKNHIEKIYSGSKRECTILTENENFEYLTNKEFDNIFREKFEEKNIVLEENTAYRLLTHFPCTEIILQKKSSFFEITKTAVASENTKNETDTNKIIFDERKLDFFAKVISEIILKYLEDKGS